MRRWASRRSRAGSTIRARVCSRATSLPPEPVAIVATGGFTLGFTTCTVFVDGGGARSGGGGARMGGGGAGATNGFASAEMIGVAGAICFG